MNFKILFPNATIIEPANFIMDREHGATRYMFFHFVNPIEITIEGKSIVTNPGAIILFSPNYPQIFHPYQSRLNHDYVDFETIDKTIFEKIHFPLNTILYPRMSKAINAIIKEINAINREEEPGFDYEADAKFTMLLLDISRSINKNKNRKDAKQKENLQTNFEQLRLNLYINPTHITVSSLAASLGFSTSYFNRIYKEVFHVAPINDISNARIEYSKSRLLQNDSISILADALGFSNNEYFYRWFKKMTGMTPKEYINSSNNEKR